MSNRGASRISVALVAAALLAGLFAASGGAALAVDKGPAGSSPTVTTMDGSSATFDVRNLPPLPATSNRDEFNEHHGPRAPLQGPEAFAEIGSGTGPQAVPAPAPLSSFEGLAFNESCTGGQCGDGHPPDTNGDVGPTYYVQTINTAIGIYDKSTGARVAAFTFNSFMSQGSFGNLCDTDNFGDPVVLYDTFTDRWVITDFAFQVDGSGNVVNPPGAYQCIAVSQSGNPVSGGWNFYSIHLTDGLHDYPKLGIWPDGIYMSANMFDFAASGGFQNVRVWALDKTAMYAGQAAQVVSFDAPARTGPCDVFSLLPSNARVQTGTPPVGRENLFSSVWCYTTLVRVWKFHVDWGTPANSTFTGPIDSSVAGLPWTAGPGTVPELDGNDLDTLRMRLMMQNQYSNIGGVESLWNSHTVGGTDDTQSAVRWYQVPVTGGTVGAALQASTYNPDAHNRFMPSIAVDRLGNMAIGYSVTSATLHPAIRYAGRLAGDPVSTITQTETALINGAGAQVGNCGGGPCERWGDYSTMTLDPNGCTFWYTNEYYADLSLNHKTRIGSFRYPGCTDAPPPMDFSLAAADSSASTTQGAATTFTINISRTNFPGAISLSVSGLPAGATASFSPNPAGGASSVLTITTSNCGTVTPRGLFHPVVSGTASGLTRTATLDLTVTNGAPKVGFPVSSLYANATLGSSTVPVRTAWSGCDPDGVTSYLLQRQVAGGAWYTVTTASPTSLSLNQSLTFSSAYRYRVRATDGLGATSAFAYGSTLVPRIHDNTSSWITYTGAWTTSNPYTPYWGGTVRYATTPGASATFSFTGSSVSWIAYRSSTRGSAQVYVDGVLKGTINLNAATATAKLEAYAFGWATSGAHTLKVVVVSGRVDIDAFVRLAPS